MTDGPTGTRGIVRLARLVTLPPLMLLVLRERDVLLLATARR